MELFADPEWNFLDLTSSDYPTPEHPQLTYHEDPYGYYYYYPPRPYYYYYPNEKYDRNQAALPIMLFSLMSFIMQGGGLYAYIWATNEGKDNTSDFKGMLFANQWTWAMTGFSGIWAANSKSSFAYDWFWRLMEMGFLGTVVFNWIGLFYAQYKRETEDRGSDQFTDGENLINLGVNLMYNMVSFGLHRWLQTLLCDIQDFEYRGFCYEQNYYSYYYSLMFGSTED